VPNFQIDFECIDEYASHEQPVTLDLDNPKLIHLLVLMFGNACYSECRVVGHSREAAFCFVHLIQRGGYEQGASSQVRNKTLFREGDGCFPASDPFIFVAPVTTAGDRIDFNRLEEEMQAFAEDFEKSQAPRP
jgi:hypothetical protein